MLLDRNLDIVWCDYAGVNISYISKNSIISWLRSFSGGLLSTCGITYAGADCIDDGEKLGIHGKIGVCPADNIYCEAYWDMDDYIIKISGSTYESVTF